jgi:hypothetical protein
VIVVVKDELTFDFVEFHTLAVELGRDVGLPVFGDLRKLLGKVDLGHGFRIISDGERSQRN